MIMQQQTTTLTQTATVVGVIVTVVKVNNIEGLPTQVPFSIFSLSISKSEPIMTLEKASIMRTIPAKKQGCLKQEISSTMKLSTTTLTSSLMTTLLSYWDNAMERKSDAIQSETWNTGIKRAEVVRFHICRKASRTQKLQRSDCR